MVGQSIQQYAVEKEIGAGGMGVVYLATDTVLRRLVALKMLQPEILRQPAARERFFREARAVAALNHPSIATIFTAGEHEGQPFLAMEFVEGKTLREELAAGPLASAKISEYAVQMAQALAHAHQNGVLHRDIKSANIVLTREGGVKLLDFGLAKIVASEEETQADLTQQGSWVGTMHYVAPEVLSGQAADFRSDLYSLGVVLYEMCCGALPFDGLSGSALVGAILRGQFPSLRQRNPALPAGLVRVVERAMSLRPADRFASAAELAAAVRDITAALPAAALAEQAERSAPALAIVEFHNLSGDPAFDWLGTGIAETLSADLKKLKALRILGRERVQQSLRQAGASSPGAADLEMLGRDVGARWVVCGSYQRAGERVRITPLLLDVESGDELRLEKVDGKWDDVFDLQDQVVRDLMSALELKVDSSAMERIVAPETQKLEAYEQYAHARKLLLEFRGKESLEEARERFERAVALDPEYALAFSGLGATHAMRFIHRTDPEDLGKALGYLERARELDAELGEPYPWLCYVYSRQGKPELAIEAGRRGVKLQPDLFQAHYFLGAAYMIFSTLNAGYFQESVDALLEAHALEPGYGATLVNLGWIALNFGEYERAQHYSESALELERGNAPMRFVGSGVLLGELELRRGRLERAGERFAEAWESISGTTHVYREAMLALTACGLGELALLCEQPEAALAEFRRAARVVKEYPRMLGNQRVASRVQAGLAAAHALAGEQKEARRLLFEVEEGLRQIFRQPQTFVWQASDPQLCYALAQAFLRADDRSAALEWLQRAVTTGWRDGRWLESDPLWRPLSSHPRFQVLMQQVASFPALRFELAAAAKP